MKNSRITSFILAGLLLISSCNLISDPECEIINYKALEPINGDPVFVRVEVENVSENDYAYGVKCFIKAYEGNTIRQIRQVSFGTLAAGESLEANGALDSLNSFDDVTLFKMTLEWYGDTDARFKKDYEYNPEDAEISGDG